MSRRNQKTARKPATKFSQLRKKLGKNKVKTKNLKAKTK